MNALRSLLLLLAVLFTFTLTGCDLVAGIFEAGMWTALIIIVLIVLVVGWIWRKLRGPGPRP